MQLFPSDAGGDQDGINDRSDVFLWTATDEIIDGADGGVVYVRATAVLLEPQLRLPSEERTKTRPAARHCGVGTKEEDE